MRGGAASAARRVGRLGTRDGHDPATAGRPRWVCTQGAARHARGADTRTADPHRYVTYTQTVSATAPAGNKLVIAPASYVYAVGQKIVGQHVQVPGILGLLTLRTISLSGSNTAVADVQGSSFQLLGGGEHDFGPAGLRQTRSGHHAGLSPTAVTVEFARALAEGGSRRAEGKYTA